MIDRLPAHSIEAEQGVLGCIFLDPNECIADCLIQLKGANPFYDLRHQVLYDLLCGMFERRDAIDVITVQQQLKDANKLQDVGGIAYLSSLPDTVPSAANLSFYLNIVREKAVLRGMLGHCTTFADKVYEHSGPVDGLIEEFESGALAVAEGLIEGKEQSIKDFVKKRLAFYEECHARGGGLLGLSTGYPDLDRMWDGMKPGDMIVLAARPSLGKTSLAMNIVEHVAIAQNCPVGVFSLEMSADSLVGRLIGSRARVSERTLTRGAASEKDMAKVATASLQVSKAPIFIDDTAGLTVTQLRAKGRRMMQRHKIKLAVIDYLQLLRTARRRDNRQEETAEISTGVKAMAKELGIPVIAICQLNREMEKDKERKPRISDLRESGQIEQDADVIGMLYNTDVEAAKRGDPILPVNLLTAKQRNGPTGDTSLMFFKEFCRFESVSKIA